MKKQIIITIGREFGSGGRYIAQHLSEKLGITLYDKELIGEAIEGSGFSKKIIEMYDEKPVSLFTSRVNGYGSSIEEHIASRTFDFIREKAESGESFVVVGRCGDQVLRDNPNALHVFVLGDINDKIKRIMELYNLSESKAKDMIKRSDKQRKTYHNYYSDTKWGDSRGYDICINSSKLGIDRTVDAIINYIDTFKNL